MIPKNVFIASGVVVFVYLMMKLYMSSSGKKASNTDKPEEETKEETREDTSESAEPELKVVDKEPMKRLKLRPNFFIGFQVNNTGIHVKVKELQEKLIAKNPTLFPALIRVSTLHVTLAVTHLANATEIKTIKGKLDEWAEKNLKVFFEEPCILSFSGVKTFNSAVAYVDIDQCSNYKKIMEISNSINDLLSSTGFTVDNRSFTPHLTFLKLSRDFKLIKKKKTFKEDFESLLECQDHFGKQKITSLQLLSMDDPKDEAGYYKCYHEIKVSDAEQNMDHSECCNPLERPNTTKKRNKDNFSGSKQKK